MRFNNTLTAEQQPDSFVAPPEHLRIEGPLTVDDLGRVFVDEVLASSEAVADLRSGKRSVIDWATHWHVDAPVMIDAATRIVNGARGGNVDVEWRMDTTAARTRESQLGPIRRTSVDEVVIRGNVLNESKAALLHRAEMIIDRARQTAKALGSRTEAGNSINVEPARPRPHLQEHVRLFVDWQISNLTRNEFVCKHSINGPATWKVFREFERELELRLRRSKRGPRVGSPRRPPAHVVRQ